MTRFFNAPDGNVKAWYCRGESKQHPHPPQLVLIQRTGDKDSTQLVAMSVITPDAKKLLDEFQKQWYEQNKIKYRPDRVFKGAGKIKEE
jgi:hypothetical protein